MTRTSWDELPKDVRDIISRNTSGVISAESARGGSAEIAFILTTDSPTGRIFLKGGKGARARIELKVQPFLPELAPRLLWHAETSRYVLMAFEFTEGTRADFSPDSADLPRLADTLATLTRIECPNLPVLPAEKRWAPFAKDPAGLDLIRGDNLVHTDLTMDNFVIGERVRIIDWAWPTSGAAWLDVASMVVRLIQAGHSPRQAEDWAGNIPVWRNTPRAAVRAYTQIRTTLAQQNGVAMASAWERYLAWLAT
jgi:hypothetical protein